MLEQTVCPPDSLKAHDCFSRLVFLEIARAEFEGQCLKAHQLEQVAHAGELLNDNLHRLIRVACVQ